MYFKTRLSATALRPILRDRFGKIWRFRANLCRQAPGAEVTSKGQWWKNICFVEVPVEDMDMDYHVQEVRGITSQEAVDKFQSDLYKAEFDAEKPQWRAYILNGIADPREPDRTTNMLLIVVNHAIADGISLVHVLLSIVDDPPKQAGTQATTRRRAETTSSGCCHVLKMLGQGCGTICSSQMPADTQNKLKIKDHRHPSKAKTCAMTASVPLARVKEVKSAVPGATVNDVLLAMITASLRAYYAEQRDRVATSKDAKVRGSFIVNMRKPGEDVLSDESFGNRFTVGNFKFPLAFADYRQLVESCHEQSMRLKASPEFCVRQAMTNFVVKCLPSVDKLADTLLDDYGKVTGVLSNVAGPADAVSLGGAEIDDLSFYAFAPIGLYFGVFTYNDKVNAGISLDPTCDKDAKNLAKFWAPEFAKLYSAVVGRPLPGDNGTVAEAGGAVSDAKDPWSLPYAMPRYDDGQNFLEKYAQDHGEELRGLAADANVLLHADVRNLMQDFLALMSREGSDVERRIYGGMAAEQLVLRMLRCRPLTFWLPQDVFVLKTGKPGEGGFERIGTNEEQPPLVLEELQSYDEMALAALVDVSVPTPFFNDGNRNNRGHQSQAPMYPFTGVYTAAIGARFERERVMEHAHMVVTPRQNTRENGYGPSASGRRAEVLKLWARFYGRPAGYMPEWNEAQQNTDRYVPLPGCLFDPQIYKRRMRMSIEPFLLDADDRAARKGPETRAYAHVVGLGVGAWALEQTVQTDLMLEVYRDILAEHELKQIGTIDFSWFGDGCKQALVRHDRIRIVFSRRNPAEPVGDNELLVAMYAWDGNAYPGNEYWDGHLNNSGDPAAACCSAIPYLQNPDANARLRDVRAIRVLPSPLPAPPVVSAPVLPPGTRLCILGGTRFQDPQTEVLVAAVARRLAGALGNGRAVIVTGGMAGVQEVFAKSFAAAVAEAGRDPSSSPVINLLPRGQSSGYGVGQDLECGDTLEQRMEVFGALGRAYLSFEGGPGVAKEAKAAYERGALVLPFASTGGASGGMFGFPEAAAERPPFVTQLQWDCLARKGGPPERAASAAVDALMKHLNLDVAPASREEVAPYLTNLVNSIEMFKGAGGRSLMLEDLDADIAAARLWVPSKPLQRDGEDPRDPDSIVQAARVVSLEEHLVRLERTTASIEATLRERGEVIRG